MRKATLLLLISIPSFALAESATTLTEKGIANSAKPDGRIEQTLTIPSQTSQPTAPALADSGLAALVAEALKKNPEIQSAYRQVEALRHRVPQARTLPDPTLSVGWAGNPAPFSIQSGDPSSSRAVTASQSFPYPGKLKLRGEIADREAEAAYWDYENVRRRVIADVKSAYYDYAFYNRAIETTQKNRDLLKKLSQIAEARYRVGKGIQQDVLKSQVEITLIDQRLTVLDQQLQTAQARLNTLLFREPETPLPTPAALRTESLYYSLEQLYEMAMQQDTGIQRNQRMIERNQFAVNLAHREYYPDLSVSYMYQQRPSLPDMYGATASVNIPIFYRTKQREAVSEAAEQLISSQRSKDSRQTELYFAVKEQYLLAKASERLFQLYSQAVVPQSSLALESSMSTYQVGNVDFLSVLSNFTTILDYQVSYYRELANYNIALARLEPLVGAELNSATSTSPVPEVQK